MPLDSKYVCSSDLEGYFVDKTTGLPLASGIVTFYSDVDKTTKKNVYQLTGTGPYNYAALPNPITLNSVGAYQDGGNNIVIYYVPFIMTTENDPTTASDDQELYYVTVEDSGSVSQFTRDAWPPLATNLFPENNDGDGVKNYVPNGQFLSHNNTPITDATTESGIDIIEIAQGGWSFKKTTGGTGVYTQTFNTEPVGISGLIDFPPFSANIACTTFGNEVDRDLVIQWADVNAFSKKLTGAEKNDFNFLIAAKSASGSSNFNIRLISNFGVGGDATVDTSISTIAVTTTYQYFNATIPMPNNDGKNIGTGHYVAIAIRGPSGETYDARFTDGALTLGNGQQTSFPVMSDDEMLSRGVAGLMPTPNPDGSDLYMPLALTQKGMVFDHSSVGQIIGKTQTLANSVSNELIMDGLTNYIYTERNAVTGIPYSRLADYLILNSPAFTIGTSTIAAATIPLFGTGSNFVTLLKNNTATKFDLNFNTASGSNVAADGDSGFTHTSADPVYVYDCAAGVPTAGQYFSFTSGTSGLVFNAWFSMDGVGTAPAAPTGANIEVLLVTADTTSTIAGKVSTAINKYQFALIDSRGYFWRGLDLGTSIDPDSASRTSPGILLNAVAAVGGNLGTLEAEDTLSHLHAAGTLAATSPLAIAGTQIAAAGADRLVAVSQAVTITGSTANTGGNETRPLNLALNWFIKY